jgi:hypothetical protein
MPIQGPDQDDEPQPWLTRQDGTGWRVIPRVRGRGVPPLIRVTVDLDNAQSAWLRREAERTGLGYDEVVARLIDRALKGQAEGIEDGAVGPATPVRVAT